jgi:TonB-dependent SusC/RagA subfamily outer membrane receptor
VIALWMLHATALAALLGAAALLLEGALRVLGRPVRWGWAAAMALALVLPVARAIGARVSAGSGAAAGVTLDVGALPAATAAGRAVGARGLDALLAIDVIAVPAAWLRLDLPLAAAWTALTLLLAVRLLVTARRTAAQVRRWPSRELDGGAVRVAPALGPAVFGAVRTTVIVPHWALIDAGLPLMLAHERAHVRARDPLLLAAALMAVVLMPWNAVAWWLLRRLRLAVELDCDARVLAEAGARPQAVRTYGALLLDVARRSMGGATPAVLSPTLLATPSTLTRRIHAMTTPRPRRALPRALPAAAAAALLVAAACELPRPTGPRAEARAPLTRLTEPTEPTVGSAAAIDQEAAIARMRRVIAQAYPAALEQSSGRVQRYWFVQEASGRVSRVLRGLAAADAAPNQRLSDATMMVEREGKYVGTAIAPADADGAAGVPAEQIEAVDVMKLAPGRVGPDAIQAIWVRLKGADVRRTAAAPTALRFRATIASRSDTVRLQRLGVDGQPMGEPTTMRLRATMRATMRPSRDTTGARPLYFVDGVEHTGGSDGLPKPDRIESIDVLKGATAIARYGQRAVDGVIAIKTKQ